MLACFLEAPRKVAVKDVPIPKLAAGDILVRMEASGICGTDLEKTEGQLGPGGILENKSTAKIEKVPDKIMNKKPGNREVENNKVPCNRGPDCPTANNTLGTESRR